MDPYEDDRIAALFQPVLDIVRAHPQGLSEHDLLRALDRAGVPGFEQQVFETELSLFQCHFVLFHVLHRLRDRLLAQRTGDLRIHFLRIVLLPYVWRGRAGEIPEVPDDLHAYYLDLENLRQTGAEDVKALLDAFWRRYAAGAHSRTNPPRAQDRDWALGVLGLDVSADADAVRLRYRRLVMQHHPDRGGDKRRVQELNAAMAVLRQRR